MSPPKVDPALEQVVAENLDFLHSLVEREDISNAELRRSSVAMRHLVYEDQLQRCASAREHSLRVTIPETQALAHNIEADNNLIYFQLGGYKALGIEVAAMMIERRPNAAPRPYDPNATFEATMKTYKRQPVMLIRATAELATNERPSISISGSITRETLIKYVAHKAGGAHYDVRRTTQEEELLDIARKATSMAIQDGIPTIYMNHEALENPILRAKMQLPGIGPSNRDHLDPVLLELLGGARILVESPSVLKLRAVLGS